MLSSFIELFSGARQVVQIKTFQIIVAQGIVGSVPWAAMAFNAMWLELIGFSHATTAILIFCFSMATSFGALFGGFFGDRMATWFPSFGRIICAQISSGIAVPMSAILLRVIPQDTRYVATFALVLTVMGFLISWNASATNKSVFFFFFFSQSQLFHLYFFCCFPAQFLQKLYQNIYGQMFTPWTEHLRWELQRFLPQLLDISQNTFMATSHLERVKWIIPMTLKMELHFPRAFLQPWLFLFSFAAQSTLFCTGLTLKIRGK